MRYSTSKNSVTLKTGLGVVQSHWPYTSFFLKLRTRDILVELNDLQWRWDWIRRRWRPCSSGISLELSRPSSSTSVERWDHRTSDRRRWHCLPSPAPPPTRDNSSATRQWSGSANLRHVVFRHTFNLFQISLFTCHSLLNFVNYSYSCSSASCRRCSSPSLPLNSDLRLGRSHGLTLSKYVILFHDSMCGIYL